MSNQPLQQPFCTTREAAKMLGVSLRTAQLWAESGLLTAWKTRGGHRRITMESVEKLRSGKTAKPAAPVLREEPPRILVVEDDPIFQELYEAMLPRWAMRPSLTLASNGFDALVRIGLERPDMLITDLDMPGMDGFEMLRSLQSMPEMAGLAVIVVSGLSDDDIKKRNGLPAAIPLLNKPIDFSALEKLAIELLDKQ